MRRLSDECCATPDHVDSSRQPALNIADARRLTCRSCGHVVVNIHGEYNPDIDDAIAPCSPNSEEGQQ